MKKTISILLSILMLLSIIGGMNFLIYATDYNGTEIEAAELVQGDTFRMGNYPQSKVTDDDVLSALNKINTCFRNYNYICNENSKSDSRDILDICYVDIQYKGSLYRKVIVNQYRPYRTVLSSSADNTDQDENEYIVGNTYYFKWEPIVWQVLEKKDDGVIVVSRAILDAQAYNQYDEDTTWETCSLRTWLNCDFYNSAFSVSEKSKIVSITSENEDNPNYGTEGGNNTTDALWLLSYSDVKNSNYGFSSSGTKCDTKRRAQSSDYAKSQGLWVFKNDPYTGNSDWRLRTIGENSKNACFVAGDGSTEYNDSTYDTSKGIRPSLKLDINSVVGISDDPVGVVGVEHVFETSGVLPTCTKAGVTTYTCTVCGYSYSDDTPMLEHNYVGEETTPATTTSTGVMTYICTGCGDSYTEVIPMLEPEPVVLTGWQKVDGKWHYYDNDGKDTTGWAKLGGKWYYFNNDGVMQTGWQKLGGKWYYFNSSGAMQTGWQKLGGKWYYFNSSGAMQTGWQKISGKWYLFNSSGAMLTGWQKSGGKWYYFNSSGAMQTGWQKIGGKWYYFESSGAMRTANLTYKGKVYKFNSSGACLNP